MLADQPSADAVKLMDEVRGHRELDCLWGKTDKESKEKPVSVTQKAHPDSSHQSSSLLMRTVTRNLWRSGTVKAGNSSN